MNRFTDKLGIKEKLKELSLPPKGYYQQNRGRNSHHTLIAFINQTRMVIDAWLRP